MKKYESYKPSGVEWIGDVPSHWTKTCIKHVAKVITGNTPPTSDEGYYENGTHLWVKPNELNGLNPILETNQKLTKKGKDCSRVLPPLSILVNGIGRIGEFGYSEKSVSTNQQINAIVFNKSVQSKFGLYHVAMMKEAFLKNAEQVVVPILNKTRQENIEFILPPLPEQSQIVSYLDRKTALIDSLIAKTERKIALLKEKRTAIINQAVTKGLDPNVPLKDSGVEWIGEIPEHWETARIKHVAKIYGRIGYRGYTTEDIVEEGLGAVTISPSNIQDDIFNLDSCTFISWEKYHESPEIKVFPDDIILVKTGSTIGKTSIIPYNTPEMTINPQLVVLKNLKLDPSYLYYQTTCRFIKESFHIEQTGSTTPTISQEKINDFPVIVPSLNEQLEISNFLDLELNQISRLNKLEQTKIEKLKEYRQALISEVVTGKIKVTEDV